MIIYSLAIFSFRTRIKPLKSQVSQMKCVASLGEAPSCIRSGIFTQTTTTSIASTEYASYLFDECVVQSSNYKFVNNNQYGGFANRHMLLNVLIPSQQLLRLQIVIRTKNLENIYWNWDS